MSDTPPSSRAPVEPRHRELAERAYGLIYQRRPLGVEEAAQLLADAEAQAVKKMREWKDSGYKTIEDFRTALKACGKTQDEMIAMVEMLLKYYEEMADINGPLHRAESELSSLQEQLEAKDAEIDRLKNNIGCARNQGTTQFCAEAVALQAQLDSAREDTRRIDDILACGMIFSEARGIDGEKVRLIASHRDYLDVEIKAAKSRRSACSGSPPGQKEGGG